MNSSQVCIKAPSQQSRSAESPPPPRARRVLPSRRSELCTLRTRWTSALLGVSALALAAPEAARSAMRFRALSSADVQGRGSGRASQDSRLGSQKGGVEFINFSFGPFGSEICSEQWWATTAARIRGQIQKGQTVGSVNESRGAK